MAKTVVQPSAATISKLRVSPKKVSLAGRQVNGRCVKPTKQNKHARRCRRPIKLTVSYTLNRAATLTFTLKRTAAGRKVGGKCVKPTSKNRHRKPCTQLISIHGKLVKTGTAGANRFVWQAKIGGHKLGPDTYQLTATPTAGKSRTAKFTIVG
jgi:hypothetical protein